MPTFTLTPDLAMGKDRSKDGDAPTSSTENKDHSQDQESRDTMLARTIAVAVAGALVQQKSEETQSITARFSCLFLLGLCINIYYVTLGNVARVYPWIVQGLTFLSA